MKKFKFFAGLVLALAALNFGTGCTLNTSDTSDVLVTKVTVTGSSTVAEGSKITLTAAVTPSNAAITSVSWKSSNTAVATVTSKGVVTGVKAGTVTITATANDTSGKKGTKTITVTAASSDDDDDSGDEAADEENDAVTDGATDGTSINPSGKKFVASSSDASAYTTLVWSDEFEGNSIKTDNWTFETGNSGWGNAELENYTNGDNCAVEGGVLHITAKSDLTSTRIKTQDKKYFQYGKMEARLKTDQGAGSWPAFWMLGQNMSDGVQWPNCGEIDIMEHANSDSFIYETLHWNYEGMSSTDYSKDAGYGTGSSNYNGTVPKNIDVTQWHIYGVEWTPSTIKMYVDDNYYYVCSIGSSSNGTDSFNYPFFFLINFAMGGNFVSNWKSSTFTNLPWNMYVDYVRVYQDADYKIDGQSVTKVTGVTVSGTSTVEAGSTTTLTAAVTPSNATNTAVTWSSSDSAVATVSTKGVVTGVKAGTATITATAADGSGAKGTMTVTVTAKASDNDGEDEETETNLITTATVNKIYFAPDWTENSAASATGDLSSGITYILPAATYAQWQAQLFLATDADLVSGKAYKLSFTANTTAAMNSCTVKWASDTTSSPAASWTLDSFTSSAGTAYSYSYTGTSEASITDAYLIFDFGNNEACTVVVSDLKLVEEEVEVYDPVANGLSLVWYDEFDYTGVPDTGKWKYQTGNGGWGNNELQNYIDNSSEAKTAVVGDGVLTINAYKEDNEWKSARMNSITSLKYGYIEARMKITDTNGAWPAFWMMPNDSEYGSWPASGEIDIMENAPSTFGSGKVFSTLHASGHYGGSGVSIGNSTLSDLSSTWHTCAVRWTEDKITAYYDGVEQGTYENDGNGSTNWPYDKNFYVILNLAIGGDLGNTSDAGNLDSAQFVIDYVRWYQ